MSVLPRRRINVSLMPNVEGICIDLHDGKLGITTLQSQYKHATGLKYLSLGQWVAVTINENNFVIPENEQNFVVVTDTVERAQSIMSNSLAMQVSSCFGGSSRPNFSLESSLPATGQGNAAGSASTHHFSSLRKNLSRKQSRTLYQKPKQLTKEKVFKVVFVNKMDLPCTFSKEIVLAEGFFTIKSNHLECEILSDLLTMLKNCDIHCNIIDLVILTNSSKTLSIPCTTSDFMWSLETIKKNVGQGKMYVMVAVFQDGRSSQVTEAIASETNKDGTDSDDELQRPPFGTGTPLETVCESQTQPSCDDDETFVGTGTPTVSFRRNRLSLTRRGLDSEQLQSRIREIPSTSSINSLIEVCDSEDEEICRAIEASLHDNQTMRSDTITNSLEQILKDYQDTTVDKDVRTDLIVSRTKVLHSAYRGLDRKSFNPRGKLYIKFSGELGQDYGGPRREFFRLALKDLIDSTVFEGPAGRKYFTHSLTLLDERKYRLAGRLVSLSLAQDGPGLHGLHPALYDLMTGLEPDMSTVVATMPTDVQDLITQLENVDSDSKRDKFLSDYMDWLIDRGFSDVYRMSMNEKDRLILMVKKQHLYYRTLPEITDFKLGLNDIGNLWELVKSNAELFKPLFCQTHTILTKAIVDSLCQVVFSEQGSNLRAAEDETIYSWEVLLQDIQDGNVPLTLEELLVFISGAEKIPPCGFDKPIEIMFYDLEGLRRLPSASTCALQLWLPRGVGEPDNLSSLVQTAVRDSEGFHKV